MKTIRNLTKQDIVLEGFGFIQIEESLSGNWIIDFTPTGSENKIENMMIRLPSHEGSRYIKEIKPILDANK